MNEQDTYDIDVTLDEARTEVERGKALSRLYLNQDFKDLVIEGFFRNEAIRLVHAKSSPHSDMQSPEMQNMFDRQIIGVGSLNNYFTAIDRAAQMAASTIEQYEEAMAAEIADEAIMNASRIQ